jgi:hypothetical protein
MELLLGDPGALAGPIHIRFAFSRLDLPGIVR